MRSSGQPFLPSLRVPRPTLMALAAAVAVSAALTLTFSTIAEAKRGGYTRIVRAPMKGEPLTVIISLEEQRLQVFDSMGVVAQSPISSGRSGYRTPTGIFTILQKAREHYSNLYDDAPMPNMQRITWSGVALHAGALPGYPASHGCIRLPYGFSDTLFSITDIGTRVIVLESMKEPQSFRHPRLFAALPPGRVDIPMPVRRPVDGDVKSAATGIGTVSAMLGVTPAAAAEAALDMAARAPAPLARGSEHAPAVRTRAIALAERQGEIDRRASIVSDRQAANAAAAAAVNDINARLAAARQDLKSARLAELQLKRTSQVSSRTHDAAERRMRDFIRDQQRETTRWDDRSEARWRERMSDGASDMDADTLLKRIEARNAEAERDNAARTTAAEREVVLEADLLQSLHDQESAERAARAQKDVIADREAAIGSIEAELVTARKAYATARNALDDAEAELKRATASLHQFGKPATIFISRRSGKLKVRQGYAEVFETPVVITSPDATIGTHVFSASRFADDTETALDWQALTLNDTALPEPARRRGRETTETPSLASAPAPTAANALDRITLSGEAKARIAELIKPGSTLIISDADVSPETGANTDIIVQPRL